MTEECKTGTASSISMQKYEEFVNDKHKSAICCGFNVPCSSTLVRKSI